jgi:hypothetical protein
MATKKQLAEQVWRVLEGGTPTPDSEFDIREIMLYIDQLRDKMATISVFQNIKSGEYDISHEFLKEYPGVAVNTDTARDLRYVTLPVDILDLPYELGLYTVHPPKNPESAFVRVPIGAHGLYSGMRSFDVDAITYMWISESRVYFKSIDTTVKEVHMILCPSSKVLGESDTFLVPANFEDDILKAAVEFFSNHKQIPHDEVSDGVK